MLPAPGQFEEAYNSSQGIIPDCSQLISFRVVGLCSVFGGVS
jgi:hypothetical protein